jgi:hypothetical protein
METQSKSYIYSVLFIAFLVVAILVGLKFADNANLSASNDNQPEIVGFNDYSENKNELHSFFEKLLNIETQNRSVRIAFFGDSFSEGDILSGTLKHLFQKDFGRKSVILDSYSIGDFCGTSLQSLSHEKLPQFNNLLQYDLIILGHGLNVIEAERTEYEAYEAEMIKTVDHLKALFSNASILLLSVPDRSHKKNDNHETMPGILAMVEHQKNICQKSGIAFWNLFEAMGGKNSMPLFVNSDPPKADEDHTHFTFAGGEHLGKLLFEAFMFEKEIYKRL